MDPVCGFRPSWGSEIVGQVKRRQFDPVRKEPLRSSSTTSPEARQADIREHQSRQFNVLAKNASIRADDIAQNSGKGDIGKG